MRRTRARSAACSCVGSGATVSVMQGFQEFTRILLAKPVSSFAEYTLRIRLVFATRLIFKWRSEARGHRRRRRGIDPARPRTRATRCGAVALAAESADPR